jgi:uncharacterized protein YndB with AHSA1/START domain
VSLEPEAAAVVAVPIEVVYRAASDLAHYPLFMVAARRVTPIDGPPAGFRWVARSGLRAHTWDVEISERVPNERVSWRSHARGANDGTFRMEPLGDQTRVTLRWACEHQGMPPPRAASLSLANFKRAVETGQRQRRALDPALLTAAGAALALIAGAAIGTRVRALRGVRRRGARAHA